MDARSKLIADMSQLLARGNKTMVLICNSFIDRIFIFGFKLFSKMIQQTCACSKSTIETLEKGVKCVQS